MEKNVHDIIGNHTSCLELRKSQLELEKTLTKANIKMNQMSLSDKNYKAAFLKMLNQIHIQFSSVQSLSHIRLSATS